MSRNFRILYDPLKPHCFSIFKPSEDEHCPSLQKLILQVNSQRRSTAQQNASLSYSCLDKRVTKNVPEEDSLSLLHTEWLEQLKSTELPLSWARWDCKNGRVHGPSMLHQIPTSGIKCILLRPKVSKDFEGRWKGLIKSDQLSWVSNMTTAGNEVLSRVCA